LKERKTSYKQKCIQLKQSNNEIGVSSARFVYVRIWLRDKIRYWLFRVFEIRKFYYSIKLHIVCIWQYLLSTRQLVEYIYTYIYSLSTANYPLENETYGHKRDSFAAALAHNGIVTAVRCFAWLMWTDCFKQ